MERLKLNVKEFLAAKVNSGKMFITDDGCGCLKGNFYRSSNSEDVLTVTGIVVENPIMVSRFAKEQGELSTEILLRFGGYEYSEGIFNDQVSSACRTEFPQLQRILDRGESIHMGRTDKYRGTKGRPQFAKLFVLRALRMSGLVELVYDEVPSATVCESGVSV